MRFMFGQICSLFNRQNEKIRFLIVGGLNTAVGLITFPILYFLCHPHGMNYMTALVVSQIFCITFSFANNKLLVFKSAGNIFQEYFKYVSFQGIYLILNLIGLPILVEFFHLNPIVAQTGFAVVLITISYFWHRKVTFI